MPNQLRQIREARGMTLEQVASLYDEKATAKTISRLEREERKLTLDQAKKLAKIYQVDIDDIAGEGAEAIKVPIVGYVGAGEVVNTFDDQGPMEWITPPRRPGAEDTHAVIVRGDSMWPVYKPGDLLFYVPSDGVALNAMNEDCVIRLADGQMYVKTLRRGSLPGRYRLVSARNSVPDIDDAEVQWAAKIRWVERR